MSAEYSRDHCKIAVVKILQTLGWHSINSTPLEVLTDLLSTYIRQMAKLTNDYANEFGQTEPNLDHLGLAFQEMGVNLSELEEYVSYVNFIPPAPPVPKFPIAKESNLNFLKPGSKEVLTRPIYVHEHLPPMYPLLEEQTERSVQDQSTTDGPEKEAQDQFKKPADVNSPEFKRLKREEEGGRPTREISSVMMTTSGFLSPAREGKLPEAKAPAPPPEPPKPPTPEPPLPELIPVKKKPDKKREKGEEKASKKAGNMKEVLTMKRAKAAAAAAAAANAAPPAHPAGKQQQQPLFSNAQFPGGDAIRPPHPNPVLTPHKAPSTSFNKALAAAKAKTERLNTTITPIPAKTEPRFQPPPVHHVDKLESEPDRKKINIFKKISSSKEKSKANNFMSQQAQAIVNKINLSNDITIEPINPSSASRAFFADGSPPVTPPTPRTPEILAAAQNQAYGVTVKEKRKRKEKADKGPKAKRPRKQQQQQQLPPPPLPHPHFLEPELLDMNLGRPKTPDAHPLMRKNAPQFPTLPMAPNAGLPFPFPLANFGGPGLIPPLANPLFPFVPPIPDFGKNPYFQPKPEPIPKASPKPKETPPPPPAVKSEPVEIVALPPPAPPLSNSTPPLSPPPVTPQAPADDADTVAHKKSKEHKKEKRDKAKKKNKKDKVKDKLEKKRLKEAKKEKDKQKKEKKKKAPKQQEEKLAQQQPQPQAEIPPTIPKILLKVNSPSPRPETPDNMKKLNIKPIIPPSPEHRQQQREPSPSGLAQISALVIGPPKAKTLSPHDEVSPPTGEGASGAPPATPTTPTSGRPPGRPRIHPLKPKAAPKPKKVEQPPFVKLDADGNEIWICPACGQQDDGRPMIGCDGCDAWYHWVCVGIQVPPDDNENWYCKPCLAKKNEDLQDRKKKRKKKEKNH